MTAELEISFDFKSSLERASITLVDPNRTYLETVELLLPTYTPEGEPEIEDSSKTRGHLYAENNRLTLGYINMEIDSLVKILEETKPYTSPSLKIYTVTAIAGNPMMGLQALKLFQYFELLGLLNVKNLPKNLVEFLKLFSENFLDLMPNFIEIDETYDRNEHTYNRRALIQEIEEETESSLRA